MLYTLNYSHYSYSLNQLYSLLIFYYYWEDEENDERRRRERFMIGLLFGGLAGELILREPAVAVLVEFLEA